MAFMIKEKIEDLSDELEIVGDEINDLINNGCEDTYNCALSQLRFAWIKLKIAFLELFEGKRK